MILQPRSQGFSLEGGMGGKSPGNEVDDFIILNFTFSCHMRLKQKIKSWKIIKKKNVIAICCMLRWLRGQIAKISQSERFITWFKY